jgi:hypothetical protein
VPLDVALDAVGVPVSAADALVDEVRVAREQLGGFPS